MASDLPRTRQADPIVGGGALKVEGCGDNGRISTTGEDREQQSRATGETANYDVSIFGRFLLLSTTHTHTAAATAVSAVLAASKPRTKMLTPKQRLGKILGLSKQNKRKL